MNDNELNVIAHAEDVTLYWAKPADADAETTYRVTFDSETRTVPSTHASFDGLGPETEHQVTVEYGEGDAARTLHTATVRTTAAKKAIDVSAAPYNAVGDGVTLNTTAIQRALDDCDASSYVYVPEGTFLTGSLRMHSDSELVVDGVLQGTANPDDYMPFIHSRFEGTELDTYSALINIGELDRNAGVTTSNVIIRGKGTIYSGGRELMTAVIAAQKIRMADELAAMADYIATCEKPDTIPGRVRPRLVNMSNAGNVELTGVTFGYGASWNLHMIYSKGIVTHDLVIESHDVWNGDGWDPDSSEDCTLFGCHFKTGDDMVAIKSGKNPEGNEVNRPTKHVRVFDCKSDAGHAIAVGSEMSGGVEDVAIWDCDIRNCTWGMEVKATPKRGGYVRNVSVRDVTMPAVVIHAVPYNDDGVPGPDQPYFEDFTFERVHIAGRQFEGDEHATHAIEVVGFEKPGHEARNISFKDVTMSGCDADYGTVRLDHCQNVTFENLRAI